MNKHDIGDKVEVFAGFTSRKLTAAERKAFRATAELPAGIGVDPTTVKCHVRKPDGSIAEEAVAKDSAGVYLATVEPDQHGTWYAAFDGTEGFQASGEHSFEVRAQDVPR
jgi:hypothetical protein